MSDDLTLYPECDLECSPLDIDRGPACGARHCPRCPACKPCGDDRRSERGDW